MIEATGSQIITGILERKGIEVVAGIPGGSILPLYDELARSRIRHVLVRHEQGGGFLAQGMARSTGKTAVCLATSGPGAMNLLTAIADARCDSIPLVAITGQVNSALIGTDAFQEADTFGLSMPITKHSVMVKNAAELLTVLPEAFRIAETGRPGPVLIDVPRDVQLQKVKFERWPDMESKENTAPRETNARNGDGIRTVSDEDIKNAAALIAGARRPVLYCGGGAIAAGAAFAVRAFAEKCSIPVTVTLLGLGIMPVSHPLYMGMVGMHGNYCANRLMHDSDLIIAAGARFDDRATGVVKSFCPEAKIIHIDIDAAEINKIYKSSIALAGDAAHVLPRLTDACAPCAADSELRKHWLSCAEAYRKVTATDHCSSPEHPSCFIPRIAAIASRVLGAEPFVATDVGQHQMWTAQFWPFSFPRQFLTSGSLGTMGFGLPAAIGAALANPGRRVVCLSGDGSIMMNVQELATLAELDLDVTIVVFDNSCLGMVRQQQEILFNCNYSACLYEKTPALVRIAEGFNITAFDIPDFSVFDTVMEKAFSGRGPRFVRLAVRQEYNVYPFVPAGRANVEAAGLENLPDM